MKSNPVKIQFLTVMPSPYQRELFSALARSTNFDLDILYFTSRSKDRDWHDPTLGQFESVMPGLTLGKLGDSANWNPSVLSRIRAAKPDLVVVSDYSAPTAQLAMRYLALAGPPFIFWGEMPGFSRRGPIGSWLRSRLQSPIGASAGIAAIGEVAAQAYRGLFPRKPIFNIPYFCDLKPYQQAAAFRSQRSGDTVEILYSGQMIDRKGVDVLLAAFVMAAEENRQLHLKLLGSGPEAARYSAMVPAALADRVKFIGHKEPSELPAIFAEADIFCLPSRHDGWGVVVNEALGAGLPILVSDAVGAGRDLVQDGINGFVTPVGDAPSLAAAIARLASDDGLRREMAAKSREFANSWGLDEGVRRWKQAAERVLGSGVGT